MKTNEIICGDALEILKGMPEKSIHCCVTSPPYWGLRDYKLPPMVWGDGWKGCIGLEPTPEMYIEHVVEVARGVWRVLRDDGTLWLNLGDSYGHGTSAKREQSKTSTKVSSSQHDAQGGRHGGLAKQLIGVPWRVAFALQADGWYLRSDIIWSKPNPMPESVTDRPTKAHEYIFLMTKGRKYYYDADAVKEGDAVYTRKAGGYRTKGQMRVEHGKETRPTNKGGLRDRDVTTVGRNKRTVWTVATQPYREAHFATFPEDLIIPCIKAGCPEGGIVLDPFMGAGTTGLVAAKLGRRFIGIDLSEEYCKMARKRIKNEVGLLLSAGVEA